MKYKYGQYYDMLATVKVGEYVITDIPNKGNDFISFSLCMKRMADRLHPGMELKFRTTDNGYIKFFRTR